MRGLQWGSETGSRRRPYNRSTGAPHKASASMGLRDWVSEKAVVDIAENLRQDASMGLRDWVSEKAPDHDLPVGVAPMGLQWGSETGSRRRKAEASLAKAQEALLQWGSETGSRRRGGGRDSAAELLFHRFNGAPRLGLGEGYLLTGYACASTSFNGAPRLGLGEGTTTGAANPNRAIASMGLRDWVSEKG